MTKGTMTRTSDLLLLPYCRTTQPELEKLNLKGNRQTHRGQIVRFPCSLKEGQVLILKENFDYLGANLLKSRRYTNIERPFCRQKSLKSYTLKQLTVGYERL